MPLNRACIGKIYPPVTTTVTLAALARYARAYNDDNPRYFDPAAPGGIVAPPMFGVTVTWLSTLAALGDPDLHADLLRLLHRAHDLRFPAPLRPGDVVTSTSTIAAIDTVPNGETISIELDATNQHGEPVQKAIFTAFIRGRRAAAESRAPIEPPPPGAPIVVATQTIDADQTFRYAEASGDRNPIHTDANVATMAGLPGIIVHGLCTMALTSKIVIDRLCAGDPTRLKRLAVRFSRPVFPRDTITTRTWPAPASGTLSVYTFETRNADGDAVIRDAIAEVAAA